MRGRTFFVMTACLLVTACESVDRSPGIPIGSSTDSNGRPCATYQMKSDRVYETRCDYGGQYPASVSPPVSQ